VTNSTFSLQDARMADAGTTSKKVAVNEGKGLSPPVTNSAIRAAIGFIIVIAVAAALAQSFSASPAFSSP
jgi:hypothetical protein